MTKEIVRTRVPQVASGFGSDKRKSSSLKATCSGLKELEEMTFGRLDGDAISDRGARGKGKWSMRAESISFCGMIQ